jgi:hypothetical protein
MKRASLPQDLHPAESAYARTCRNQEYMPRPEAWDRLQSLLIGAPALRPKPRRFGVRVGLTAIAATLLFMLAAMWYLWPVANTPTTPGTALEIAAYQGSYYAHYLQEAHHLHGYTPVNEGPAVSRLHTLPSLPGKVHDSLSTL